MLPSCCHGSGVDWHSWSRSASRNAWSTSSGSTGNRLEEGGHSCLRGVERPPQPLRLPLNQVAAASADFRPQRASTTRRGNAHAARACCSKLSLMSNDVERVIFEEVDRQWRVTLVLEDGSTRPGEPFPGYGGENFSRLEQVLHRLDSLGLRATRLPTGRVDARRYELTVVPKEPTET